MAQQPNIEVDRARAPLPELEPGPARRQGQSRPGEINSPDDVAWGGSYGTPGPDTGWALGLIRRAEFDRSHRGKETETLLAALVAERVAEVRGIPLEQLARTTTDNFYALFSKAQRPERVDAS